MKAAVNAKEGSFWSRRLSDAVTANKNPSVCKTNAYALSVCVKLLPRRSSVYAALLSTRSSIILMISIAR